MQPQRTRPLATCVAVAAAVILAAAPFFAEGNLPSTPRETALAQEVRILARNHPALRNTAVRQAYMAYADHILSTVSTSMPNWQYWLLANDLATWLHDPHTQAGPPILTPRQALLDDVIEAAYPSYHWYHYSGAMQLSYIPLGFYWTANGLIAMPMVGSPPSIHLGDEVVRVGKLTIDALQERLTRLISGNRYWVRSNGAQDVTLGYFLHWLGVVSSDGAVQLTLRRADGQAYTVNLPLEHESAARLARVYNQAYETFLDAFRAPPGLTYTSAPFAWRVAPSKSYAVFWLRLCWDSPAYQQTLDQFFQAVTSQHVPRVVFDLQENPGGNSAVINPILQHLRIHGTLTAFGGNLPVSHASATRFRGQVYVLTSPSTFSSAVWVADALYANGLAVTVGQPTGLAPSAFGQIDPFVTGGSTIVGQVSTRYFQATGPQASAAALVPTIPVPLTVGDVQAGRNPVARWLQQLGKRGPTPIG